MIHATERTTDVRATRAPCHNETKRATGAPAFIKSLKEDYPPAAAGLLAKFLPPALEDDDPAAGAVVNVIIQPSKSGFHPRR